MIYNQILHSISQPREDLLFLMIRGIVMEPEDYSKPNAKVIRVKESFDSKNKRD